MWYSPMRIELEHSGVAGELAGRTDHMALNGIDRWMGGVHLTDGRWRWDPQKRWLALF